METSAIIFIKILQILAGRYSTSFSLEEITQHVTSHSDISEFTQAMNDEKENQSKLLDLLILMDQEGYIFLNSYTDESLITIKGLIKINNKIFWS